MTRDAHSCGQCECCEAWRKRLTAMHPRTCGTCRHADAESAPTSETRFCTLNTSWFSGKLMHMREGCTKWAARDEEDGA